MMDIGVFVAVDAIAYDFGFKRLLPIWFLCERSHERGGVRGMVRRAEICCGYRLRVVVAVVDNRILCIVSVHIIRVVIHPGRRIPGRGITRTHKRWVGINGTGGALFLLGNKSKRGWVHIMWRPRHVQLSIEG